MATLFSAQPCPHIPPQLHLRPLAERLRVIATATHCPQHSHVHTHSHTCRWDRWLHTNASLLSRYRLHEPDSREGQEELSIQQQQQRRQEYTQQGQQQQQATDALNQQRSAPLPTGSTRTGDFSAVYFPNRVQRLAPPPDSSGELQDPNVALRQQVSVCVWGGGVSLSGAVYR